MPGKMGQVLRSRDREIPGSRNTRGKLMGGETGMVRRHGIRAHFSTNNRKEGWGIRLQRQTRAGWCLAGSAVGRNGVATLPCP